MDLGITICQAPDNVMLDATVDEGNLVAGASVVNANLARGNFSDQVAGALVESKAGLH